MSSNICSNKAYSLIEIMISTSISLIIFAATLHYLHITIKSYNKLQHKIDYQNAQLIAYYYLSLDIRNSGYNFKPAAIACKPIKNACLGLIPSALINLIDTKSIPFDSDILILNSAQQNVVYYVKPSVIPKQDHMHSYALYRDDFIHNSTALIEGIIKFDVKIDNFRSGQSKVQIKIDFKNNDRLEAIFITRNTN